ncbi:MAG TPA: prepilin-type N-terminal cleavage/methylation domain-containing protein [Sedimenticola sp.]|nr:prepilin-type N-terminal cleavage/methylation domain-containing protein [Sedimenticola sp.]
MKQIGGFTLIELMITLAVAVIVLALGIPAFNAMLANNRASAQANSLVTALAFARSEAAKRGLRVALCPRDAPGQADFSCGGRNDWVNGWMVFTDASGKARRGYRPPQEDRLRLWPAPPGGHTVTASASSLGFSGSGELDKGAGVLFRIRFSKCTGAQNRDLRVHPAGRVEVTRISCP